jgi:hypothetical protein
MLHQGKELRSMTAVWTRTVRDQIRLGRIVPLGGPAGPAWIVEQAAAGLLRAAACRVDGVRLGALRVGSFDAAGPGAWVGDSPPGALPRGPLRIEAAFHVASGSSIPAAADRLRQALWDAAHSRVGLEVMAVDLTVTGLLDGGEAGCGQRDGDDTPVPGQPAAGGAEFTGPAAAVVEALPGVGGLGSRLGGFSPGVRVLDDHAEAQIVVTTGHRPLDVGVAVRDALVRTAGVNTVTVVVIDLA